MSFVTTQPEMLAFAAGGLESVGSAVVAGKYAVIARSPAVGYPELA